MTIIELSKNEVEIVRLLRELRPFEVIELTKDQLGRLDHYIVHRKQKIVLTPILAESKL
jgi:hypothetical protein